MGKISIIAFSLWVLPSEKLFPNWKSLKIFLLNSIVLAFKYKYDPFRAFPYGSVVKNMPANTGDIRDTGSILCCEDPLEKDMTTHFSILKSHRKRSLVGYSPWGLNVRYNLATEHTHIYDPFQIKFWIHFSWRSNLLFTLCIWLSFYHY